MSAPRRLFPICILTILVFTLKPLETSAQDAYRLAIGDEQDATFALGIALSSLIKVKLLPKTKIDLDAEVIAGEGSGVDALRDRRVDFALVDSVDLQVQHDPAITAVAQLLPPDRGAATLLARPDVAEEVVHDIAKAIFEDVTFLAAIDPEITGLTPENAVLGLKLPLHAGAKRYFESLGALQVGDTGESQGFLSASETQSIPDAQSFKVYFDFDDAALDQTGLATVERAIAFARSLSNPAILIAGHTDSVGDADYNYLLAERRTNAVLQILRLADLRYANLDVELFGEREQPELSSETARNANNRRVELFIERPVPPLEPLPLETEVDLQEETGTGGARVPIFEAETASPAPAPAPSAPTVIPEREEKPAKRRITM
ncbi:MAG: phosphate ABC transporter substrate-binding/OmpA family protein [Alphaproteobacteria bacterium]